MAVFLLRLVSQYLLFILPEDFSYFFYKSAVNLKYILNTVSRGAWWAIYKSKGSQSQTQVKQVSTHASF